MARDDDSEPESVPTGTAIGSRARARAAVWPQRRKLNSTLHVWERLEIVQRMLARGMAPTTITTTLMSEHGVERHEAEHYQAVVRARWKRNGAAEDNDQEFLRIKAVLLQAIQDAASRKVAVRTGSDPDTKEPIFEVVEQPDSKAVIAGAALWARMIGRLDPPERTAPGSLPANGEPGSGEARLVDRNDANEELRKRRATST
jgi:hypothetical protein